MAAATVPSIRLDEARTYSMRELNQNTAGVLAEINKHGQPAAITRHGRFIALITPLEGCEIETLVLRHGSIASEIETAADASQYSDGFTPDEARQRLDDLYSREDR